MEGIDDLSPRERDVLSRAADGLTNKQIAVELCISAETVKSHLASVLRKLEAPNRAKAAAMFGHDRPD